MIKIGITGGIGSGKSVVAELLTVYGVPVYTADAESKRLTDSSASIREKLVSMFGESLYENGTLDRKRLASFIFSNEQVLKKVNDIIHPVVKHDFENWALTQNTAFCALESAILYESGFDKTVDVVVEVYAPIALRLARVMARDGLDEAEVMKRMNRQMPDDLKREKADYVIINDDENPLIPQVERFVDTYNIK